MNLVPKAVGLKLARQALIAKKNSPVVLFGAGVVGMVTTTVLACRATLKVEEVLEKTQSSLRDVETVRARNDDATYSENDAKKDKAYIYIRASVDLGRLYGPAIIVGGVSIAALIGSQNILSRRNAALTAAYAAMDKGFRDYRDRVSQRYGEEKEREIYQNLEPCEIDDEDRPGKKKKVMRRADGVGSIYARLFDSSNPNWNPHPEYNVMFLRSQMNYFNDQLTSRGHLFLNEVYNDLGMPHTREGSVVGWVKGSDGDNYVDFGIFDSENMDRFYDFVTGREGALWVDFNVDGVIYDKI